MCIIITRKVKCFASNDKNHDKAAVVNADFKKNVADDDAGVKVAHMN